MQIIDVNKEREMELPDGTVLIHKVLPHLDFQRISARHSNFRTSKDEDMISNEANWAIIQDIFLHPGIIVGWKNVKDGDGKDIPFDHELLKSLVIDAKTMINIVSQLTLNYYADTKKKFKKKPKKSKGSK